MVKHSPWRVGTSGVRILENTGSASALGGDVYLPQAELVAAGGLHRPSEGCGHHLSSQTHPEHGQVPIHGLPEKLTLPVESGEVVVGGHGPAEGHDYRRPVQRGRLPVVMQVVEQVHRDRLELPGGEYFPKVGGEGLFRVVADDQGAFHAASISPFRRACPRFTPVESLPLAPYNRPRYPGNSRSDNSGRR